MSRLLLVLLVVSPMAAAEPAKDKAALAKPAFDAVRDRPDFQTLAAQLGKPPATK